MLRYFACFMILLMILSSYPVSSIELTGPVAIISNSIDMPTAEKLKSSLTAMGFEVEIFPPERLADALKYCQFLIVLGGHKAAGVSELVAPLLSSEEKSNLERKGYAYYFIKRAWGKYIVIIAGNDRFGTYRAANTFIIKGMSELKSYMESPSVALVLVPMGG